MVGVDADLLQYQMSWIDVTTELFSPDTQVMCLSRRRPHTTLYHGSSTDVLPAYLSSAQVRPPPRDRSSSM